MTIRRLGRSGARWWAAAGLALLLLPQGCKGPLERSAEQQLRESVLASNKAYTSAIAGSPVIELKRSPSSVETELTPERRAELERMSGPSAYAKEPLDVGSDLLGVDKSPTVGMTLQRAIALAIKHDLEIQQARLLPAISETQLTQAEAQYDPLLFTNVDFQKLDTPRPQTPTGLEAFGSNRSDTTRVTTGIRKVLTTGGEIRAQSEFARNFANPSFFGTTANPAFGYSDANLLVGITQPLLRNFGPEVSGAQVSLAQSARAQSVQDLRRQLLDVTLRTEQAYWDLVLTRQRLLIQLRLLGRTITDRDTLRKRGGHDVSPVQLTEASSFVEIRRAEVIRARRDLRLASDTLKRLLNAPELPLSGESLILPLDEPADLPVKYSLLDAVATAIRRRPELQRAILEINDASIRLLVADNARLPQLNLGATVRYNGVGRGVDEAFSSATEASFIDYLVSAQFEMPIGNRGPEALYRQRQIERQALTLSYQRAAQDVLVEVKKALRQLVASYDLIGAARAARLAASDNLRAIEQQERIGAALTPEFLDLKLSAQQRLAETEIQEMQSLTDYNTAVAALYQAMGTLLERNNIDFEDAPRRER